MSGQLCLKWNNHTSAFNKILSKIYSEDLYSDATILCQGKFYPVHRLVLSTCSEYFDDIFQQCKTLNNKHPFIIVKDVKPEQMEALLNYMYKGEVNVPQEVLPELIKAAEAFKIKGLAVPDDEEPVNNSSKKRQNTNSSSPTPIAKKSRKNLIKRNNSPDLSSENESISNSNNIPVPVTDSEEIYLDEPPMPLIKSEPIEVNNELAGDKTTDKKEDIKNEEYIETEPNYEYYNYDGSTNNENFDTTQSTSWDNSPGFTDNDRIDENITDMMENDFTSAPRVSLPAVSTISYLDSSQKFKVHQCPYCIYSTPRKGHMNNHLRTHTGEKPFSCTECGYRTADNSNLKKHISKYHKSANT